MITRLQFGLSLLRDHKFKNSFQHCLNPLKLKQLLIICSTVPTKLSSFIETALRHGCPLVNLLHIFRTSFLKNTSGRLLLKHYNFRKNRKQKCNLKFRFRALQASFDKQHPFWTQPQYCLTFPWIELQMLLGCRLIHITIITLRHILQLVYLCPCLVVGLFMSQLCDLLFIFSLIFIVINHKITIKQRHLFFAHFLGYLLLVLVDNVMKNANNF